MVGGLGFWRLHEGKINKWGEHRGEPLLAEDGTDGIFVYGFDEESGDRVGWGVESHSGEEFAGDETRGTADYL